MTFDRYGHLYPDSNKEVGSKLDEAIFGRVLQAKFSS
jgi:hypothetical protein